VDASVGVKLVLVEALSNEAHALFAHLARDPAARFFTPELFDIECANILWKQVRRFGCPLADAQLHLAHLGALAIQRIPVPTLAADALSLGATLGISAYDGCYVALAQRLGAPLVTADSRLVAATAGIPSVVFDLGRLTIPPPPPCGPASRPIGFPLPPRSVRRYHPSIPQ
jgi:predicted nucleic acid-binding protein